MDPKSTQNRFLVWFLALDLAVLNVASGYLIYKFSIPNDPISQTSKIEYVDQCGADCQAYIDAKLATPAPTPRSSPTPTPSPRAQSAATPKTKTRTVSYVTVPGSGQTSALDWTSLSGTDFYFNTADYPGLVEVYFEINMKLVNGNGKAYVRLLDVTHGIGVQGSDVATSSQTSTTVESGKVAFWSGKNLIRVQAKSLTADTAVFDSGRLRIVTEN